MADSLIRPIAVNVNTGDLTYSGSIVAADSLAASLGYINWNYNNAAGGNGSSPTSQRADAVAIWLPPATTVTSVMLTVVVAGTSTAPTGFYVGLCSATKMLAQSNNLASSSNLTATGTKAFALASPYLTNTTDSSTGLYYVVLLQNGAFAGTNVQFQRQNASTNGFAPNGGVVFGNIGTGLSAPVANGVAVTPATSAGLGWHVGVA